MNFYISIAKKKKKKKENKIKNTNNSPFKETKDLNRHFQRNHTNLSLVYKKIFSTSLREIEVKIIMRYYLISVKITILKKTKNKY